MKKILLAVGMLSLSGLAFAVDEVAVSTADAETVISGWPLTSQSVARVMIEKYGQPEETTTNKLIWRGNGDWKRSIVHRDGIAHNYPRPHMDVLEQVVDYKVPIDKYDDLASFDGSVSAHRTKGELSVMCDKEENNYLAMNLATEIAEGKRSVSDARRFLAQTVKTTMAGKESTYIKGFQFAAGSSTADPDSGPAPELK